VWNAEKAERFLLDRGRKALIQTGCIQPSLFDQTDMMELVSDEFPGERLIVCWNRNFSIRAYSGREVFSSEIKKERDKRREICSKVPLLGGN
jgi:hypothetical protein